jgi:hypothetical protein
VTILQNKIWWAVLRRLSHRSIVSDLGELDNRKRTDPHAAYIQVGLRVGGGRES